MKKLLFLMAAASILAMGCASEQKGCPSSNYYTGKNVKQNRSSSRQMNGRVF